MAVAVPARTRPARPWLQEHWFLILGLASGLVLRILVARSIAGWPDADEATGILMAVHLAHGEFRTFFWGQNYGGSLATLVEAPLIRLFGHPVPVARVANTAMTLVCALVVRAIGRRLAERWAGDVAAVAFWLLPSAWLNWSTRDYLFWVPGVLVALLAVLACLRWDDGRVDRQLWQIGFLAGVAFWAYPLLGTIIVPAVAAVAWANRRRPAAVVKMFALVPVGAAPWILTNLRTGFLSLQSPNTVTEGFAPRAAHAITRLLPTLLFPGDGFYWSTTAQAIAGCAILGATAVFVAVHARRGNIKLALAGTPLLIWPLLVAAARLDEPAGRYRYAFVMLPSLAVLVGWLAASIRPNRARFGVGVGLAVFGVVTTIRVIGPATGGFQSISAVDPTLVPLAHYLEATGRTHIYANIWISYVLTLDTSEQITASAAETDRYAPYAAAARAAPGSTYVYKAGYYTDTKLQQWTRAHGEGRRTVIGPYAVYQFDRRVDPAALPLFVDPP